jgi:hypothetical protein
MSKIIFQYLELKPFSIEFICKTTNSDLGQEFKRIF